MSVLAPTGPRLHDGDRFPPFGRERPGGGGRGWVELTRATGDIEAHLLTGRLSLSGIESCTVTDRSGSGAFLYGGHDPWAPVAIMVRKIQLQDARILLAELAYEAPDAERPEATSCRGRYALVWWLAAIALAVAFTLLGMVQMVERCERVGPCDRITGTQEG